MLTDIRVIQEDIQGIKDAFLLKDGEVIENIHFSVDTLNEISLLIQYIRDKKGDLSTLKITGDYQFVVFLHNSYALGVVALPDVDVRLLNWMAGRVLKDLSLPAGMSSEEVRFYFHSEYRSLQKEVLKLLCEIKELKEENKLLKQEIETLKSTVQQQV